MPTVPTLRRRVLTDPLPGAYRRASETEASAGVGVARAQAQLYGALGDVGGAITGAATRILDQRERAREEAEEIGVMSATNRLAVWEMERLHAPTTGALNTKGQAAFGLPETISTEFDKVAGEIEGTLGTPRQKAAFQKVRLQRSIGIHSTVYQHVAREMRDFDTKESTALIENSVALAVAHIGADPTVSAGHVALAEETLVKHAARVGMGPEALARAKQALWNEAYGGAVEQLVAEEKVDAARELLAAVNPPDGPPRITGPALEKVTRLLKAGTEDKQAQEAVAKVMATRPMAEWRAAAQESYEGKLEDDIVRRLEHEQAVIERDEQDGQRAVASNIKRLIDTGQKVPVTEWQKLTSPGAAAQLEHYRDRNKGVTGAVAVKTNIRVRGELLRMAHGSAEERQRFVDQVNLDRDYVNLLDKTDMDQLQTLQAQLRGGKKSPEDISYLSNVTRQNQMTQRALRGVESLSPASKKPADVAEVDRFYESVERETAAKRAELKRNLTDEEHEAILDKLLLPVGIVGAGWFDGPRRPQLAWEVDAATAAGVPVAPQAAPLVSPSIDSIVVPPAERSRIIAGLVEAGKPVVERTIKRVYRDAAAGKYDRGKR
jgi:hypothetical protein